MVELVFWNCRRLGISWDTSSGSGRLRLRAPKSALGWAFRSKGTWYGLWRAGKDWILQRGTERWSLKAVSVSLEEAGKERIFRVLDENRVVLQHAYVPKARSLLRRFDPTYDSLDEEMEDFFLWTARSAREAGDEQPQRSDDPQH